jgi:hypothetical protein
LNEKESAHKTTRIGITGLIIMGEGKEAKSSVGIKQIQIRRPPPKKKIP